MKKLAIMTIGIPGSGKTTALKPLILKYGLERISRDDIRQEMFGDPLNRSSQDEVWAEADRRVRAALAAGKPVVLDSTFAERKKRAPVIATLTDAGAERIVGIIFSTPVEVAKERNRARDHIVKDEVIDLVASQLAAEPPALKEGFAALYGSVEELELHELRDATAAGA